MLVPQCPRALSEVDQTHVMSAARAIILCQHLSEDAEYVSGPGKSRALMAAKRMEAGLWLCGTDNKVATAVQSHQFPDDIYSRRWTLLYQTPDL